MNADSVRIDVTGDTIDFRFFKEEWENEVMVKEEEVTTVSIPRGLNHEVAIYTGDDPEPYDYTDWFAARNAI